MKGVQFHPEKALIPLPIVEGARMWSVALEKTMLTYFEIDPECRFDLHSHVNEQITMVLEGELFFKFGNRIAGVKKGEVIAIPSNLPHEVFTQKRPVIAVDAWSPVVEKYRRNPKGHTSLECERILSGGVGMKP